jgi:RNA polymerase primary sigma factor
MDEYRSTTLVRLAAQLLRSPRRLRLRQLAGIEFVISVLDADCPVPLDFVVHAVTGYRARSQAVSGEDDGGVSSADAGLRRDELRQDLIRLAEDLSRDAELLAECWSEPVFPVADLAERFDVSSKTIFRWHRRGLIGWRMRYSDGRQRLAFPEHCVQRFVAHNAALVRRGSSFSQLTDEERREIVARAEELVQAGEKTVNAVAKVIAGETRRAVETVRLILRAHDTSHPKRGIFNRSHLQLPADDGRLAIWEAYVDGASLETLSRRFGKPVRAIYRIITEMRARDRKSRPIDFVPSDEFEMPGADGRILNCPDLRLSEGSATPERRIPRDLPPYLQQLFRIPLLTPKQEVALFRKLNYLRYKAERSRVALDPESATAADLDRMEQLLDEAQKVKNAITQANLRLVVSIAKRHMSPGQDFFELVSDGNMSLMRAVDRFDYSRGFKFSTYGSWAIMKNFARSVPEARTHRERYQTGREELLDLHAGPQPDDAEYDATPEMRAMIDRMLDTLDERDSEILRQRFGLDAAGDGRTLEQIGDHFGVSKERIRQLEARAIQRLRSDFGEQVEALIGEE